MTKLVLMRHATRSHHEMGDSELTAVGRQQSFDLIDRLAPRGELPTPTRLMSSPKRRARQTLHPISELVNLPIKVDERLDERKSSETLQAFEKRVRAVLDEIASEKGGCTYICSHLDWLEAAMELMPSDLSELEIGASWATTEYRVFKFADGLWVQIHRGFVAPKGAGT